MRSFRPFLPLAAIALIASASTAAAQQAFSPPASPRATYNFNPSWKFLKADAPGSEEPAFDDSKWETVSTPHTWNDVDSFDDKISRSGEGNLYMGPGTYRKHFKLPAEFKDRKIFIEFEGMRQAGKFFLNGKPIGKHENGVTATGVDLTSAAKFGDEENVLTVKITNVTNYAEESSGQTFQWESKDFNPNYGGLQRNVALHTTGKLYQTLPLYDGLATTGTYVYATDFNLAGKTATITVESQVRNEAGEQRAPEFSVVVVDAKGNVAARFKGDTYDMVDKETAILKASAPVSNLQWWSPESPTLYTVYSMLTVEGKVVDVRKTVTGFRKAEFKGGAGTGGLFINDKFVYLKGYAQRTVNEWAAVGGAYPNWMYDFDTKLMADGNANYMRWMHIAPKAQSVASCDKYGIVQVVPAGDKEANPNPAQWEQRMAVMRDTIIYYRNSPSVFFWEAGNNGIPANRMQQMVDLRKELDPHGGRAMGCRSLPSSQQGDQVRNPADNDPGAAPGGRDQNARVAEWFGVMVGQDARTDRLDSPTAMFRAYTNERRDIAPIIETEDFRDESLRRHWDKFSPPAYGFKKGPNDTWDLDSEQFCLAAAKRYNDYWSRRISIADPSKGRYSAYASIIWADSNQHGRLPDNAVCRVSGKVDAVRLPKQAYFAYRVMQNESPDSHIIGHWNYPADTTKTMYVVASNVDTVELLINGKSMGKSTRPMDGFIYSFPNIKWEAGSILAVGSKDGKEVTRHELKTAGAPAGLKLTPYTAPGGLTADGADVAFFDVEVVDAQGNRCPLDESRIDFELSGPAIWRGGLNAYMVKSTNNTHLMTECGINRVFIRATDKPGKITLTAKREGFPPATVSLDAKAFKVTNGLAVDFPVRLP